jgi:hypothetical protein
MAMGRDQQWLIPAIAITTAAVLCTAVLDYLTSYPGRPSGMTSLVAAITVVVVAAFFRFMRYFFGLWRSGEVHPAARIRADFLPAMMSFAPIGAGVVIVTTFLYSITFLKSMIPVIVPFWADEIFAATDRILFVDPQALALAMKPALPTIGLFYGLWHVAHLGGILWVLHWRAGNKARHILSFMLTWSIGMVFAYLFASMGPLFSGGYDPAVAPESVRLAAEFLWANYQAKGALIGGGISAFPSMHVAVAAWLAIVLRDRGWPKLGISYFIGVFAGSVILGWHYAIDGAAGALIALAADRIAMAWLRRWNRSSPEPTIITQPA